MLYKKEFGVNFDLGFNLSDFPQLHDNSYHNDVCPSFWFESNGQYFILWVDYEESTERELQGKRYTIINAENFGCSEYPEIGTTDESVNLLETEYFSELKIFLSQPGYNHQN